MAAERVLLDTSLLAAASVEEHPGHPEAVAYLDRLTAEGAAGCISPQVCREFMVVLTRKPIGPRTFSVPEALAALAVWRSSCTLLKENEAVVAQWLGLLEKHDVRGKQVHEANLVAVMLTHGVTRLGTRNPADFERYGDAVEVEPITS